MPLSVQTLKQSLRPLFQPDTMPSKDVIGAWCKAYAPYASVATAGVVALPAGLVPSTASGEFFSALDTAFRTMWMSAAWVGPGVTAVTSVVPPLQPFLAALAPTLLTSYNREQGLSLIAEAIHTYTLSIVVAVTPPSGTPVPTKLT